MRHLKIFVLILFVICLTGCDVTYNLTITNDYMEESVDFWYNKTSENEQLVDQYLSVEHQAYYDMNLDANYNYSQKKITNDNQVGLNLRYNYGSDKLQNSTLLDKCYYKKSVIRTDDEIVLYTDGKANCFNFDDNNSIDKLTINIKTDLKVLENNADKVNNSTYTWIIDADNYQNHPISIRISRKEMDGFNYWLILIIGLIIFGVVLIVFGIIYLKNRKNNNI